MQRLVLLLAACSNEVGRPSGPPVMPCPRTASHELPWTREVFPACAPPALPKYLACTTCAIPCSPKPRVITGRIERDPQGRITRVAHAKGELSEYHYDARGRVSSLDDIVHGHAELRYDAAGWLAEERTPDGVFVYHYDARGRVTQRARGTGSISVTYDGDRVIEVADGAQHTRFAYDEHGRLVMAGSVAYAYCD